MKSIKVYKWITFLFILSITFNSCSKDDDILNLKTKDVTKNENSNGGEITLYMVNNGEDIIKIKDFKVIGKDLEYQKNLAKHKELWDLVKKLVPKNERAKIGEFLIMNGTKSSSSGSVASIKNDLSSWQMAIDAEGAFGEGGVDSMAYVIIHEFAHILTLNDTQLDSSVNNCKNYNPSEGCARDNSYFNEFFSKYWEDISQEHNDLADTDTASDKFYKKYKNRFVTSYASTNPTEDIAESFSSFIFDEKPTGKSIANKKVLLFYNRPELMVFKNYTDKYLNNTSNKKL